MARRFSLTNYDPRLGVAFQRAQEPDGLVIPCAKHVAVGLLNRLNAYRRSVRKSTDADLREVGLTAEDVSKMAATTVRLTDEGLYLFNRITSTKAKQLPSDEALDRALGPAIRVAVPKDWGDANSALLEALGKGKKDE